MRIDCIIVLYNPKDEFLSHFNEIINSFNELFFIDNSTKPNEMIISEIKKNKNVKYISMDGNKGIAAALKLGVEESLKNSPDYILTLDQDSRFPIEKYEDIKQVLQRELDSKYGIIGLNVNSNETSMEIRDVTWIITSGNFINTKNYQSLKQGFDERLFIDGVDQDICHSFHQEGFKIGLIPGASLVHEIGNPIYHRILWKKFSTFNYPPFRYYYMFRNYYYLVKKDKNFFKKEYRKVKYYQTFKILFYEKNKRIKLKAAKLGKQDAKKGILGEMRHEL